MAGFRLALCVLGTEVFAIEVGEPKTSTQDCGTTASQVELAEPVALGFHIQPNPSVED